MIKKLRYINISSRIVLAFVFFYHGLVPKILWLDDTEILITEAHSFDIETSTILLIAGVLEIFLALLLIAFQCLVWPVLVAAIILILLVLDIAVMVPQYLSAAFNVVTLNVLGLFVCVLIFATQQEREIGKLR